MDKIRLSSRDEVVVAYLRSELAALSEKDENTFQKAVALLNTKSSTSEGPLQHLTRVLLCDYRCHSWLYEQLYKNDLSWYLAKIHASDIDVPPIGGDASHWHYPKLDRFVEDLKTASYSNQNIPGLPEEPARLLDTSRPLSCPRIIVICGTYGDRHFDFVIGDGAHRAVSWIARGNQQIEAYYGCPPSR